MEFFFSNHLEVLYQQLKKHLFPSSLAHPFTRRLVVVPHLMMKNWLMFRMAEDPELKIAMGIEFIPLNEVFEFLVKLFTNNKKHVPTFFELTLAIQVQLKKVIQNYAFLNVTEQHEWEPLIRHLSLKVAQLGADSFFSRKSEKRLVGLSQQLAHLFQNYGRFAPSLVSHWDKGQGEGWQSQLWQKLFTEHSEWSPLFQVLKEINFCESVNSISSISLHFFSISFISAAEFVFLNYLTKHIPINYYRLSPCAVFWSDICSDRESFFLQHFWSKKTVGHSLQVLKLEELLRDRNPLLANFGQLGREMACQIEESSAVSHATYVLPQSVQKLDSELFLNEDLHLYETNQMTLLQALQADLLMMRNPQGLPPFNLEQEDHSIQLHGAPSKRREVQILYHNLLALFTKDPEMSPRDIIVMAPQIEDYTPYIRAIFGKEGSQLNFQVVESGIRSKGEIAQGFLQLLELSESRWDTLKLLQFFDHPSFQRRHQFSPFDCATIRQWIEQVGISWGQDPDHREEFLHRRHCTKGMVEKTAIGTWDWGLSRLILGLTSFSNPLLPCPIIDFSQGELLDKWLRLLHALQEDLSPLNDETQMTMEDWTHYLICLFESYFQPNEERSEDLANHEELKATLEVLRNSSRFIKEERFSFTSVKPFFLSALESRQTLYRDNDLQSIRFFSLTPLCAIPAKAIALLGMQEGAFPRISHTSSLNLMKGKEHDYCPLPSDYDRYLFLELLHVAEKYLLLSYQSYHPRENKELKPSLVIEELFSYLDKFYTLRGEKISKYCKRDHPFDSFDRRYFDGTSNLHNFSPDDFAAARANDVVNKLPAHSFLREFKRTVDVQKPENLPLGFSNHATIDLHQLLGVAHDPIKFHLNKTLGIYLTKDREFKTEFALSPLDQWILRREVLKESPEIVWSQAEGEGKLPVGMFKIAIQQQFKKESEELYDSLHNYSLSPSDIFQIEFHNGCSSPTQLQKGRWLFPPISLTFDGGFQLFICGKMPYVTPKGLLLLNQGTFPNVWKIWPQFLIYCSIAQLYPEKFEPQLIVPQEEKAFEPFFDDPQEHLKRFIHYYALCNQNISPLMPEWILDISLGNREELHKKIEKLFSNSFVSPQNPYLTWSLNKDHLLSTSASMVSEWQQQAKLLVGDMAKAWYPKFY